MSNGTHVDVVLDVKGSSARVRRENQLNNLFFWNPFSFTISPFLPFLTVPVLITLCMPGHAFYFYHNCHTPSCSKHSPKIMQVLLRRSFAVVSSLSASHCCGGPSFSLRSIVCGGLLLLRSFPSLLAWGCDREVSDFFWHFFGGPLTR